MGIVAASRNKVLTELDLVQFGQEGLHQATKYKHNKSETHYIAKPTTLYGKPYIACIEAIAADFFRLVKPTLSDKVRVAVNADSTVYGALSKEIPQFMPFASLPPAEVKKLVKHKKRDLAALFVASYVFSENDLRKFNWGIDANGNVRKIDFDQAFAPFTSDYSERLATKFVLSQSGLAKDPSSVFSVIEAMSSVTCGDINSLPELQDIFPRNWPDDEMFKVLADDPEFKYWKFFYLTKCLLITLNNIKAIIAEHSEYEEDNFKLKNYLTKRLIVLKAALSMMPEYKDFLEETQTPDGEKIGVALAYEIGNYDEEFMKKKGEGEWLIKRPARIIKVEDIIIEFECLKKGVFELQSRSDFEEKRLLFLIEENRAQLAKVQMAIERFGVFVSPGKLSVFSANRVLLQNHSKFITRRAVLLQEKESMLDKLRTLNPRKAAGFEETLAEEIKAAWTVLRQEIFVIVQSDFWSFRAYNYHGIPEGIKEMREYCSSQESDSAICQKLVDIAKDRNKVASRFARDPFVQKLYDMLSCALDNPDSAKALRTQADVLMTLFKDMRTMQGSKSLPETEVRTYRDAVVGFTHRVAKSCP